MNTILVTGAAGFIGSYLCKRLLTESDATIIGLDNMNSYYDVGIKKDRLSMLKGVDEYNRFTFIEGDIADADQLESIFSKYSFDCVVNLAAQAGVRYSRDNPRAYVAANLIGFCKVLAAGRHHPGKH